MTDIPDFLRYYLHVPVRDTQTLVSYVNNRQLESEQLDFKSEVDNVQRLAERIAAFANHRGGDIVIGIGEENDHADEWSPVSGPKRKVTMQRIAQAREYIRPREFAGLIQTLELPAPLPDHYAVVISVPPSPEVVAVEANRRLSFPIRMGTHTDYLTYEDVMLRTSVAVRANYIKLCGLRNQITGQIPVRFSSPIFGLVGNNERLPVITLSGTHSFLSSLSTEVLEADMKEAKLIGQLHYLMESQGPGGLQLTIPLELIRAAWREQREGSSPRLCLALDAEIVLSGQSWTLLTGRG